MAALEAQAETCDLKTVRDIFDTAWYNTAQKQSSLVWECFGNIADYTFVVDETVWPKDATQNRPVSIVALNVAFGSLHIEMISGCPGYAGLVPTCFTQQTADRGLHEAS